VLSVPGVLSPDPGACESKGFVCSLSLVSTSTPLAEKSPERAVLHPRPFLPVVDARLDSGVRAAEGGESFRWFWDYRLRGWGEKHFNAW
jgi:hypothetical protein